MQNAFNNALLYAAAGFKVDDALTRDVAGFRDRVRARLDQLIAQYKLGISIDQINLQSKPPRKLAKAFAAVSEADVRRSQVLNQARDYKTRPSAVLAPNPRSALTQANGNAMLS